MTLIALLLSIFIFFYTIFLQKLTFISKVIKISCARGRHNMPPPFYAARYGPARLTPAALPKFPR